MAEGCIALQDKAGVYGTDRMAIYKQRESDIRNVLAEMPTTEEIKNILGRVGLGMREFYDMYDVKKIENAIMYAKDLKDRYTVLWLYYDLFGGRMNEA